MTGKRKYPSAAMALPFLLALTIQAAADEDTQAATAQDDPHAHHRQMLHAAASPQDNDAGIVIPDAMLTTQHREQVRLKTDVVADRIVVMDFVYTTCTTVCPVLSAIFSQVASGLGDRLGTEVVLVSLTVDPLRDTPEQMKAYSEKFGVGDGWVWLTSDKQTMDDVLRQLGSYTPNFEDHPSMVLVGDGRSGEWSRFIGFPGANQLLAKVDQLAAARGAHH